MDTFDHDRGEQADSQELHGVNPICSHQLTTHTLVFTHPKLLIFMSFFKNQNVTFGVSPHVGLGWFGEEELGQDQETIKPSPHFSSIFIPAT